MGTVTDLAEYRRRKQQNSNFVETGPDMRPMTWEEWQAWLHVDADYEPAAEVVNVMEGYNNRHRALLHAGELVMQIVDFELVKNYGRFRFSHAFRRCLLRIELQELARKYGFSNFDRWI